MNLGPASTQTANLVPAMIAAGATLPTVIPDSAGNVSGLVGTGINPLIAVPQLNLPGLRYALSQTKAGVRNTKLVLAGDSTTVGQYADGTTFGNARAQGYPAKLATALSARWPVYTGNFMGCGEGFANLAASDPRLSFGAGWTTAVATFGGPLYLNNTTANGFSFTPSQAFDTIDVYYYQQAAQDTFTVSVDGGAALGASINASGTASMVKVTRTCPLGVHTVNINKGSSTALYIAGISSYNSQVKGIELFNCGYSGTTTTTWNTAVGVYSAASVAAGNIVSVIQPDAIGLMLGINDWSTAIAPATTTSNLVAILAAWQLYCDVYLMTPFPSSSGATALATQLATVQAIRAAAQSYGIPLIDQNAMYGNWALASGSLGYYLPTNNTLHPGAGGYQAAANLVAASLGI